MSLPRRRTDYSVPPIMQGNSALFAFERRNDRREKDVCLEEPGKSGSCAVLLHAFISCTKYKHVFQLRRLLKIHLIYMPTSKPFL